MHLLPLVLLTTAATSAATSPTTTTTTTTQECIPFKASHGYTCLCTTHQCDSVAPLNRTALSDGTVAIIYQTAKETGDDVGDRLRRFELPLTTTTTTSQPSPARTITFDPTTVGFHFMKKKSDGATTIKIYIFLNLSILSCSKFEVYSSYFFTIKAY